MPSGTRLRHWFHRLERKLSRPFFAPVCSGRQYHFCIPDDKLRKAPGPPSTGNIIPGPFSTSHQTRSTVAARSSPYRSRAFTTQPMRQVDGRWNSEASSGLSLLRGVRSIRPLVYALQVQWDHFVYQPVAAQQLEPLDDPGNIAQRRPGLSPTHNRRIRHTPSPPATAFM